MVLVLEMDKDEVNNGTLLSVYLAGIVNAVHAEYCMATYSYAHMHGKETCLVIVLCSMEVSSRVNGTEVSF